MLEMFWCNISCSNWVKRYSESSSLD